MSEHKIEKAEYVVQSYFDHNDELVSANKFLIYDGQPETIENLSCEEVKHVLLRHGMWPQYTRRIKNLEKAEQEFWRKYCPEFVMGEKPPASSLVVVPYLVEPGMLVEITVIAAIP